MLCSQGRSGRLLRLAWETAEKPNSVWVSDITYIFTRAGWLYLTVIIDLFNRMVVDWSISSGMSAAETTIAALNHAYGRFHPTDRLIFHSDRGIRYTCKDFKEQLAKYKMIQSISAIGDCRDNAVSENFFATLKKEEAYRYKYQNRRQARQSIFSITASGNILILAICLRCNSRP